MAPLKGEGVGWERLPHLFLANYGCRLSRGYAPCLRQPTTQEWKKLPGFNPAECHKGARVVGVVGVVEYYLIGIEIGQAMMAWMEWSPDCVVQGRA